MESPIGRIDTTYNKNSIGPTNPDVLTDGKEREERAFEIICGLFFPDFDTPPNTLQQAADTVLRIMMPVEGIHRRIQGGDDVDPMKFEQDTRAIKKS